MTATTSAPLLVALVEDDPDFSDGVVALLRREPSVRLVATYKAAAPMLAQAKKARRMELGLPWDLLLMDLGLPEMDGCEATRRLKALYPHAQVLVLTVFEEPANVLAAICAGADGYLLKNVPARDLIAAIKALTHDNAPLSGRIAATVLELIKKSHARHRGPPLLKDLGLTAREIEVLRGLVDGLGYREIGERLGIAQDTVRSHIRKIYTTLQVHRVSEAVTFALRHGLV
ncbi:MAG: response regulator transcription factor [Gammaproteobacteria bacterium]|nr:response regulator transcription factor [Gammaproteobacteria bacterium]